MVACVHICFDLDNIKSSSTIGYREGLYPLVVADHRDLSFACFAEFELKMLIVWATD